MKNLTGLGLVLSMILATACGGQRSPAAVERTCVDAVAPSASASTTTAAAATDEQASRRALFEELVAKVRRFHVFSPHTEANLGHAWDALLPELKAELEAADSTEKLVVALYHFNASLHDMHSRFRTSDRGKSLSLGLRLGVETSDGAASFHVESVRAPDLKERVHEGDILVSADGVPASDLLRVHETESEQNAWPNIAIDVARFLTRRRTVRTLVHAGDRSTLVLRPRDGGAPYTVTPTWSLPPEEASDDLSLPFGSGDCADGDPKDYGPYRLAFRGVKTCVYLSSELRYRDYPIVRQTSFRYDALPQEPLADYELIQHALTGSQPKGVIIDVTDNGGGINPNLFLDWWADKPYTDTFTRIRLDEAFSTKEALTELVDNVPPPVVATYLDAWKTRSDKQSFAPPRPFQCTATSCDWDNRYTPTHRLTKAPVAVLVGPGCGSSCDAFVYQFDAADLGPLVGRPGMAGYTTHRAHFPVRLGEKGEELGKLTVAVSYDTPAGDDESIEGKPVHIDVPVPRTWANHARYDRELVDRAIAALEAR